MSKRILKVRIVSALFAAGVFAGVYAAEPVKNVLCTTFPIYQITRNVVQGRTKVSVDLMLPAQLGCPHDYALTPQDMRKLAKADVLVVNGLGMEEFLGAPVERANADLVIIDSSAGIQNTLQYTGGHEDVHEWAGAFDLKPETYRWTFAKIDGAYADPAMKMVVIQARGDDTIEKSEAQAEKLFAAESKDLAYGDEVAANTLCELHFSVDRERTVFEFRPRAAGRYVFFTEHLPFEFEAGEHFFKDTAGNDIEPVLQEPDDDHGPEHGDEHHHHHHSGVNPHLFTSPGLSAKLAVTIAKGLSSIDPEGADTYIANANAYAGRMNVLVDEFRVLGRRLVNNRIIQPHGVMDYLARDIGLEIAATTRPHGQEPSAAEMRALVEIIREKKVGAIFSEPQYSDKAARALARETGIPAAIFDPVASGPENAPLDYYDTVMHTNLRTIEDVLRTR